MKIKYYGHSAFEITSNAGQKILIDPFLEGNPLSPVRADQVKADFIILSHAHSDHLGDTIRIAKRNDAIVIAIAELAAYLAGKGLKTHSMQTGGSHIFPFGKVKFTLALHGSNTPDGHYAGPAAGILLWVDDSCIYHCGDTGLFGDMKLIGEMNSVDYMLVPIGDNFTMGPEDAIKAVEFVSPKIIIPIHYNTWPLIQVDAEAFSEKVKALGKECILLKPGEEIP
ncbi:MAG TPA: metal-dependent hydrolase [Candidatus Syntrophosphaera sp.]|nr:metal-dependent hydrolase [Candidatus Syntrophosphaera sp.]